ncbi:MAG: ATP-grasp domain-containing protein [Sulfuricurvum sp.]|uniref:ATP-grasp domain-containing protein n=1 Tax=Sulfuricurvum sp. TaxID=2025608 RepID=UPI00260CBF5A|nr:ATP-grasp domain-containing protein [Sulfuricurvum sp.]MDD2830177.1 ATP-grasp domain-containing protein [Sulfuricurvum sp.]MDD4949241.1 ATP-grasp domain-containing protein [Sulfuricurvum sp.]
MSRILLSAVGGSVAISIIRHLQSLGHTILGMDSNNECPARYFVDEFFCSPSIENVDQYLSFIAHLNFDLFFPWLDEEHRLFATVKIDPILRKRIVTSSPLSILTATSKLSTYNFAQTHRIRVADLTRTAPAFVRKDFSRGSKGAWLESSPELLAQLDHSSHIIQTLLIGDEFTVDTLSDCSGKPLFALARKRIKASNVSLIGEVVDEPEIIEIALKLLANLPIIGPANIQFIKNEEGIFLIEINPRIAGSAILSIHAGFDPLNSYIKIFHNEGFELPKPKYGLKMYRYLTEHYV